MSTEDQRIATRDAYVAQELRLAGLPVEHAPAIAEACEDLARGGVMPFFAGLYAVINLWMQYGTWGPIE